ncbi:hypothetical protein W911_00230 [Hyphomicrobium nitrativorans NL23]|uniref:Uncharacterized protein n=1 Tax=Hyphomicrobium nitrativorans NL23 TaxID=1029756 RepID=V5SGX7_9HYPH|nr:hypothetical protein [Hyphomicrobium nitrativorans]AHB49783.1 hypothetical protein W911_00230 [Hyphomicrobium nitrativorans NL23]
MAERIPLSKLAKLTQRSPAELSAYLNVKAFDESHAGAPEQHVTAVKAIELLIASDLERMCPSRVERVRLVNRVMADFSRPRDAYPALFAFDPASGRSHIEFSRSVDMGALSYRLTADAHPHPGQGFARADIGVTSSGFIVLDLAEITRRVFEAADDARAGFTPAGVKP